MNSNFNNITFSVLLSVYYKENPLFLKQALESMWHLQTLKPDEIVVVKDGPLTEELDKVIADFAKIAPVVIVALEKNQGLGAALNIGLTHCKYETIARMDSDDICYSHRFQKQIEFLSKNPTIDLVSSWIDEFIESTNKVISTRKLPEFHSEIQIFAKKRCPVNHPVVVFNKSAVIKAGGYQHFPLFEDYYLWARMLMSGAQFHNLQESLLYFRTNPETYKRRGGFKHAMVEIRMQFRFREIGLINLPRMLLNILIRLTVRLFPNEVRSFFYKKYLRR
jgi:glycosyltransferase involved in cell wall biosynthesis